MTELEALRWLQNTPGLRIYIGHDRRVTLFAEHQIEITGDGLLDAVIKLQDVLKTRDENIPDYKQYRNWEKIAVCQAKE